MPETEAWTYVIFSQHFLDASQKMKIKSPDFFCDGLGGIMCLAGPEGISREAEGRLVGGSGGRSPPGRKKKSRLIS